jgi:hypothetical protein
MALSEELLPIAGFEFLDNLANILRAIARANQ